MNRLFWVAIALVLLAGAACDDTTSASAVAGPVGSYWTVDLSIARGLIVDRPSNEGVVLERLADPSFTKYDLPALRVLRRFRSAEEAVILSPCRSSSSGELSAVAAPGDLIRWSTKGGDLRVCPKEVTVLLVGAAVRSAS